MPETQRGNSDKVQKHTVRKIRTKAIGGRAKIIKVRYLVVALALLGVAMLPRTLVQSIACPDLRIVFARGSGGEHNTDANYLNFKETIETKLQTTSLHYEFIDLDYPAIGIDDVTIATGAYFGAGEAYEFGESVKAGSSAILTMMSSTSCPNTRYVLGGYSQGAMVVSRSLPGISADKLIYAATFGDPKIYLPEGEGLIPAACKGENLSDYRMYVPDCQAYMGLLGAYVPYEPDALVGKVGTWCNKRDIFCSSRTSISDHVSYIAENLYEDASRVIFYKITDAFGLENHISSPHDTAILIDSTGSMSGMIDQYKNEALRLAKETLDSGGRVALYDYRDLADPYQPVKHCDFDTCTLESFQEGLNSIRAKNGGDTPESLLSASMHVMKDLTWKYGSTKSLVVLTDANFLSPDRDGMTFDEVVKVSKNIDPVNFYIITTKTYADDYIELANATDGKVVTNLDELNLLTDYIIERYDSLPRVEETEPLARPTLDITSMEYVGDTEIKIRLATDGARTVVTLNDAILGVTEDTEITVSDLDRNIDNIITLTPLGEEMRGEAVALTIPALARNTSSFSLPKTPNSGRR